jgi:NAD(P)H-dependent FMN reductase
MNRDLLIIYHSQTGNAERLAQAVESGAGRVEAVSVKRAEARAVDAADIIAARAVVICSPEYFGYMAGAIKEMFDRTYERLLGKVNGTPFVLVITAGNDGTGALASLERIIAGVKLRKVQEHLMFRGPILPENLARCELLGETLAAGIDLGIF